MSAEAILSNACGSVSPQRMERFRELNPGFEQAQEVELPACVYWTDKADLALPKNSGGLRIARSLNALLEQFDAQGRPGSLVTLRNITQESHPLKFSGTTSQVRTLLTRYNIEAASRLPFPGLPTRRIASASPIPLAHNLPDTDFARCQDHTDWPTVVADVQSVLRRYRDHRTDGGRPGIVVVADTGIPLGAETRLPLYLALDSDGKEFWGRYVSANAGPLRGEPAWAPTVQDYADAHHGLAVASVAGGLQLFGETFPKNNWVELHIHSLLFSNDAGHVAADTGAFLQSLSHATRDIARSGRIPIVNFSWSFEYEDDQFLHALKSTNALVVVAAGNEGTLNIDAVESYPALYSHLPNVVTVGGIGQGNERLSISAYGKRTISLAAPGCAIPILTPDGTTRAHGTSLAAPLVSLAAAIVHALGITRAENIKERLLATADRNVRLGGAVHQGSILDIASAIAVGHDVVRSSSYSGRALLGGTPTVTLDSGATVLWSKISRLDLKQSDDGSHHGVVRYRRPGSDIGWFEDEATVQGLTEMQATNWDGEALTLAGDLVIVPRARNLF
jgi:hypothetical protein